MSNGIDFVIGGKDNAKPAMASVEKSLERLESKTSSLGEATSKLATITAGFASAVWLAEKAGGYLARGIEAVNAAYDAQAGPASLVAQATAKADAAITNLMVSVGALLAPVRVLVSAGIETLANAMSTILAPAVEYATEVLENIGPLADWVKTKVIDGVNAIISAFTWLEVIVRNLDQVWIAMVAQAELYMLQMAGTIKHTLMEVIPTYAVWFGENFVDMLTGGWDKAFATLPDIAVRAISQREKDLAQTVGQVGANLGQQFADKFAERMVGIGAGAAGELEKSMDLKIDKLEENTSKRKDGTTGTSINAMESRLLTRGPGSTTEGLLKDIANKMDRLLNKPGLQNDDKATIDAIKEKAQKEIMLVPSI
jgi:hypothetical protein